MGTKSNPGSFNCYAAAFPDETIFTVLARDPAMPGTIGFWIGERARLGKNVDPEDINRLLEAARVAEDAADWREKNLDPHGDGIPTWKLPRPEPSVTDRERPVRMEPALGAPYGSQYERARLDPLYALMPKVITGLRQIIDSMDSDTLAANRSVQDWQGGIAQLIREIAYTVGPGDFTVDFSGVNQTEEAEALRDRFREAHPAIPKAWEEGQPEMLSRSRIEEFLDYATVYGDWDENTPNGETHDLSGEPMNDYRRVAIIVYKKVLGLLPEDYHLFTPEPEGEGVRLSKQWVLGLAKRLRDAPDLTEPRRVAEELELATGTRTLEGFEYRGQDRHGRGVWHRPGDGKAESDMIDLAQVPESEVPPHRFTHFSKYGRYAYARGLEVAPIHLPRALDAMTEDGWFLLAIFGATDSQHVGFIFERRPPDRVVISADKIDEQAILDAISGPGKAMIQSILRDRPRPTRIHRFGQSGGQIAQVVEEAKTLLQPVEDEAWIEQALGRHYDNTRIAMREAIDRGRMLVQIELQTTADILPSFLSTLPADTRVEVMLLLLTSRGEDCRRFAWSVLAAEHVPVDPLRLADVANDALGRIAAKLELAYRDDCSSETGGCTGYGRQMEP